jgi:NAD(P)-dependent dehydrogenase (short-subunit alcohol dehydrogenase family)
MQNFSEKNMLVVGASTGVGAAIVAQLLGQNAKVWGVARREMPVQANFTPISLDISGDCSGLEKQLPAVLHGVVYCVGSINLKPFNRLSEQDFLKDFDLNVMGAVKVLQAAQKSLKAAQGASAVLFSSVAVEVGFGFHASIAAAKGAVEGLARSLAAEWSAQKIRVNVIAPSLTDTPLAAQLLSTAEKREASARRHPLARVGTADEMAATALFLLSDGSSWMTGQILRPDGGMSSVRP